MIKHIVMWTIRDGETPRAKYERMAEMKSRLLSLRDLASVNSLEVYFNSPLAPGDNYDVILISEFNSWTDLDEYQKHPAHMEVADYLKNIRQSRSAIDFEF